MSDLNPKLLNELSVLISRSLDGTITRIEIDHIEEILNSGAGYRQYYRAYLSLYNDLETILAPEKQELPVDAHQDSVLNSDFWKEMSEYENTAPAIELPEEEPQQELIHKVVHEKQSHHISKFSIATFIVSAAAVLFFVLFFRIVPVPPGSVDVATLADQINAQWAPSSNRPEIGDRLWTDDGLRDLQKGIVKIRYDDGVDVLIEGPAVFQVELQGIYVEYGRLYSCVSETGIGFVVKTPTSKFIDQGTEFGVQADVNGSSELHVMKGKVQLFSGAKGKTKADQTVTEDHAVRYDANRDTVRSIPVEKRVFARQINSQTGLIWRDREYGDAPAAKVENKDTLLTEVPGAKYQLEGFDAGLGNKLVVTVSSEARYSTPSTIAEITYRGVPLTKAIELYDTSKQFQYSSIWYLDTPPSSGDIVVKFSGAVNGIAISAFALSGVAEGAPYTVASNNGRSVEINAMPGGIAVAAYISNDDQKTAHALMPMTEILGKNSGSSHSAAGYEEITTYGIRTYGFTGGGDRPVTVSAVFAPSQPKASGSVPESSGGM